MWEILSILTAIGLIVAIAALLAVYNGKPAPDWGERINFNALLAILSTILRAVLVVIVSQIISQRKWEWFWTNSNRPLTDLQKFDSGSRGSFGAILLLPSVLRKDLITLTAAIILVGSFLVGPSIQQSSRTTECTIVVPDQTASLPFAHYVPRQGGFTTSYNNVIRGIPTPDIITAIVSAVTAPGGVENQISGSCSTGNCTFPDGDPEKSQDGSFPGNNLSTHSTVGMCSTCTDVASLVRVSNDTDGCSVYSLPSGLNYTESCGTTTESVFITPTPNLSWMGEMLTPELKAMSRWAYVNVSILASPRFPSNGIFAMVCNLYPCLQTYTSSISNNKLVETNVGSKVMEVDMNVEYPATLGVETLSGLENTYYNYTVVKSPCRVEEGIYETLKNSSSYIGGTDLMLAETEQGKYNDTGRFTHRNITAPEQCIYRQNPNFVSAISKVLHDNIFNGTCTWYRDLTCTSGGTTDKGNFATLGAETVVRILYNEGYVSFSNITKWFDSFANVMTNRYRFEYGARSSYEFQEDRHLDEIRGLVWQSSVCISMRRGWLLLPICLTAVTTILAIWAIFTNWKHRYSRPVWKDSILPLIFYGHTMMDRELEQSSSSPNEQKGNRNRTDNIKQKGALLEIKEMEAIGRRKKVEPQWPHAKEISATLCSSNTSLVDQPDTIRQRQRDPRDMSNHPLLVSSEERLEEGLPRAI